MANSSDKQKEAQRKYYLEHKEFLKQKMREYHQENKEKINKRVSEYYKENKETILSWNKEYQKNKKQEIGYLDKLNRKARESYTKYRDEHKEEVLLKWRLQSHKRRALLRQTPLKVTLAEINELIENSNNICFWCDKEIDILHLDHVYPMSKGGSHTISNIVVSCASCNHKKSNKDPELFLEEILQNKQQKESK